MLKQNQRKNKRKKKDDAESYDNRGYGRGINDSSMLEQVQVLEKDTFVRSSKFAIILGFVIVVFYLWKVPLYYV